jgi:hypothetical protein
MIKKFEKFNESSGFNPYADQIDKLASEIDMLKKEIEKKEDEIKKLESASGDKEFSTVNTLIEELKRNGITQIYNFDEKSNDVIGNPFSRTNSGDNDYIEFINPSGIRIGVTFAYEPYGWRIIADVVLDEKNIIPIVSRELSSARLKTFTNDIMSITDAWVRAKIRKMKK